MFRPASVQAQYIPMGTCIAFFRGINVGGKNRLAMDDLVSVMQAAGASKVRTYIQSGNAVYSGQPADAANAAALIEDRHGFRPEVVVLNLEELNHAANNNPFREAEGKACHFYFCSRVPESVDEDSLEQYRKESEEYVLKGAVFYLHAPEGIGRSKLATQVERCLGVAGTGRNLNTINRLLELANRHYAR